SDLYLHLPKRPLAPLVAFRPDAVVAGAGSAWWSPTHLAALAGRRRHGWAFVPRWESWSRRRPTVPRRLADPWVRRYFRLGDACLAVGSRSARDLLGFGVAQERIFRWPLVSLPPEVPPGPPRSSTPFRFLFAGQLLERMGVDLLPEA